MATETIKITVTNLNDVLDVFDRIKIYRSLNVNGPFAEISDVSTRPVLEAGESFYSFIDINGGPAFWYQTSYFNSTSSLESEPGPSQKGSSGIIVLTPDDIRKFFLPGISITDDDGKLITTDEFLNFHIDSALEEFHMETDLLVAPTLLTETYDYDHNAWLNWGFLQLNEYPVLEVSRFTLFHQSATSGTDIDLSEIRIDKHSGHLNVVLSGTLHKFSSPNGFFLFLLRNKLPDFFEVEYTAGFETVPANIKRIIGMMSSIGVFDVLGDLISGAGIAAKSISIDGLSQSISTTSSATNAGYGARILSYRTQIKDQMKKIRGFYKGVLLADL